MKKETKQVIAIAVGLTVKVATFVAVRKALSQNINPEIQALNNTVKQLDASN